MMPALPTIMLRRSGEPFFSRFRDPDGNTFSLVSFDEVTHAVETQRRAIADRQEAERRAAQELEIAQQVQSRLFPQTLPRLRTLEYAGICHQARQVGGDYYDFLDLGGERLGLVVGDISGKGIAAALLMANLQANLRSQFRYRIGSAQRFLCSVNQLFCQNTSGGSFATLFFAEYGRHARRLRYINCGHLSALLLRADDSLDRLSSTATILGAFKEWGMRSGGKPTLSRRHSGAITPMASPKPSARTRRVRRGAPGGSPSAASAPFHRASCSLSVVDEVRRSAPRTT